MRPKLIKSVGEVSLLYKETSDSFDAENKKVSKYPIEIINEAPWSINFHCYECGINTAIFEYDPTIQVKTPVQSKFLRLVPCYSKFYEIDALHQIASAFKGYQIYENDTYTFIGPENLSMQRAFARKMNLAYSRCDHCGQEYLANYEFHYPDNERKEKPDPMICEIHEIIQTDIYFEKEIDEYIKLRNRT